MANQNNQKEGMVDIGKKDVTKRKAAATCLVKFSSKAFKALVDGKSPKGDVIETAKVAGIMAAKSTPNIIPMCHPLALTKVTVTHALDKKKLTLNLSAEVHCLGRTGVEMEALTAVSAAALTVYDMMKWADKGTVIKDIKLTHKSGGKSGDYNRHS